MKTALPASPAGRAWCRASLLALLMIVTGSYDILAQVNFTQTTDTDFNKGVLNNVVVGSNNVYLQLGASDVGTWLTTTVLPQTLAGHKTASWNNRYVYLVGGYNNLTYSSSVYRATIQAGGLTSWTTLAPIPVAMRDMAVVIGTNTIYVIGGKDASNIYNTIYYATINADGSIGAWQTSAVTLPVALWGHSAVYLNGYIYVTGGSSSMTELSAINSVYYASVNANNTLSAFAGGTVLPAARNRHSMVTYNSNLYVLGGYDNAGTKANTVYINTPGVNGAPGAWTSGTNLPVAVSNHSSVVTNGMITVMAGAVGTTLSNTVYRANADAGTLSWAASTNVMYDFTKDGSAFTGNGQVYYTGGTNLSGTAIINCRFANMVLTTSYINHGVFVSVPFYELGAARLINTLTFNATYTAPGANVQIIYRTAGTDGLWGDWTAPTSTSPIAVGLTKQYLQYAVLLSGSTTFNATFNDMTLTTPGTQLTGNLNGTATFTKALSPYWATGDISFTAGTHTFEAGATILFLPETGLSVSGANIICNGVSGDSVVFTYYTNTPGLWDGIYFDPSSDAGVSSQFYYTVISNAGFGSNNANLYCYQTNEPLLVNCNIAGADGNGIRLNESHLNIQNTRIRNNTENGLHLTNSNPTLVNSWISFNGGAGVYLTSSASVPNFSASSTTINNNMYGLRYPTPNLTIYQPNGSPVLTANTYNGIAIDGGDVSATRRWNSITYDYILLGTVRVGEYVASPRLTIEPGNTLKFLPGTQLQVGINGGYGGELYAVGTSDSTITFTPFNGVSGGWEGIYFHSNSDNFGGQSQLHYCIIEKGNNYNYYSESTTQPDVINNSIIRNSATDGARYSSAYGSITNCQFNANARYPLYFMNTTADPVHTGNTFTGNGDDKIVLSGGYYSVNRTITDDGVPYYILNTIFVAEYYAHPRLTIMPGVELEFAPGTKLQVGDNGGYGGDLYAQGTATSTITFRAYNGTSGGWEGIYFHAYSDSFSSTSLLEYCTIRDGNAYNIYCHQTTQPTLNHCTIMNSALHGFVEQESSPPITNCLFTGNNGYPLKYNDWTCNSYLRGNTYTGNANNFIGLSGGTYSSSRYLYFDGISYHVLSDIVVAEYYASPVLTLQPGVTMLFDPGKKLQVGASGGYGGGLMASGKSDSLISFSPYNDTEGGWAGIYFHPYNDSYGGTSTMNYCVVEKGLNYNLNIDGSTQPTLTNCQISNSAADGIVEYQSSASISNCTFFSNNGYPLKYNDWTCNSYLRNNIYTGNTNNFIALPGGTYTQDRTLLFDGIPYHILGNIIVSQYYGHPRLTIVPGVTLLFNPGLGLQVGEDGGNGGELYTEGKSDSLITFSPFNGAEGGWNGIYFNNHSDSHGSTSSMKFCLVEKGSGYNVYCSSTSQPTFDHCTLTGSTGEGLKLNSSTNSIKNGSFTYNASNGILLEGSSNPTIGNDPAYTCNFIYNGAYHVYNNTTNNINARNNFWNSGDSAMIALSIYDRGENSAKGIVYFAPFAQVPSMMTTNTLLSGTLKYANPGATPMKNAVMTVSDFPGTVIATTNSSISGVYAFPSFASGNYKMTITPAEPWGGVNATDALAILNHFVMIAPLTGMHYAAADVNYSHTINGTDALFVMKRYSGMITSFPAGDYLYDSDTLILNGGNVTNNINMLCFGDVNASYAPSTKSTSQLAIEYEGTLIVESDGEYTMPVRLHHNMSLGAISLGFYYPEQFIEITGAALVNGNSDFSWSASDGLFRMAWCDRNPLFVPDEGVVVILTFRTGDLSSLSAGISLEAYEDCEFADALAVPDPWQIITIPVISPKATGSGETGKLTGIAVSPNPVGDHCVVGLNLAEAVRLIIRIYDATGQVVLKQDEGLMTAGDHRIRVNTTSLEQGLYFMKVESPGSEPDRFGVIKLVVAK
jgi:parallel beta-helix repeat protein